MSIMSDNVWKETVLPAELVNARRQNPEVVPGNRNDLSCFRDSMHFFYVDESGCLGALPTDASPIQPVFVVAGMIIDNYHLGRFTWDFLNLKQEFFPGLIPESGEILDWIRVEIKGSDLRNQIKSGVKNKQRHALGFMDKFLCLLEDYEAKIVGKVFIKGVGAPMNGMAVYSSSIQSMCSTFQIYLEEKAGMGMMVLDSRNRSLNTSVSHSIFTQKFRAAGNAYKRIFEMPMFGHSDNHAGIQAADLICSAFLFPMAAYVYCWGHIKSIHTHYEYHLIRDKFGKRLKAIQFRYQTDPTWFHGGPSVKPWFYGGIHTSDGLNNESSAILFSPKSTNTGTS